MNVKTILATKGGDVISIEPTATLEDCRAPARRAPHRRACWCSVRTTAWSASCPSATSCACWPSAAPACSSEPLSTGHDAQGRDLHAVGHGRRHHGAHDDGQVPPRAGGRAGARDRRGLDRRRGQAPAARDGARVRARCATTSRPRDRPSRRRAASLGGVACRRRRAPCASSRTPCRPPRSRRSRSARSAPSRRCRAGRP